MCSSSTGQVYSRAAEYNGSYAIMYAWYWPKDEPIDGVGHRHDWESSVVWLTSESLTATVIGTAASAHGGFSTSTSPSFSGTYPLFEYVSFFPLDHQLDFTSTVGGMQPLIAYESLPAVALTALETTDFGAANVPFIDINFMTNLGEAYIEP